MPKRGSGRFEFFAKLRPGLFVLLATVSLFRTADGAARPDYDDALRIEAPEILRITILGDHAARIALVLRTQSDLGVGDVIEITEIVMSIPDIRELSGAEQVSHADMTGLPSGPICGRRTAVTFTNRQPASEASAAGG